MYRPSSANQMTTAMQLQIPVISTDYGVETKSFTDGDMIFCNFKTFGGTESLNNDIISVIDTAQITCWYRPDIKANFRLKRMSDGAVFEIIGEPENLEMRNQILYFKVERVKGGA